MIYKSTELVRSIVEFWSKLYKEYDQKLRKYNSTPRIVRWFKGLNSPYSPGFLSTTVYLKDDIIPVVVELRCHNRKLYAAVRIDKKGFLEDLSTGERTPLLGSTEKDINNKNEMAKVEEIIKGLRTLKL